MNKATLKNMDKGGLSGSVITRDQRQVNFFLASGERTRTALLVCDGSVVAMREEPESSKPPFANCLIQDFDFYQTYEFLWPESPIEESRALIIDALEEAFNDVRNRVADRIKRIKRVFADGEECDCPACDGKRHAEANEDPQAKPSVH